MDRASLSVFMRAIASGDQSAQKINPQPELLRTAVEKSFT